jgi:hypothetical protein
MLADAADIHGHKAEDANYWQLLGAKLLSVLLFAAAGTGRSSRSDRWIDRPPPAKERPSCPSRPMWWTVETGTVSGASGVR